MRPEMGAMVYLCKMFAGLCDCYLLAGNIQAKDVLIKFVDWAYKEVDGLSTEQVQRMLNTEQGEILEVCADVLGNHRK